MSDDSNDGSDLDPRPSGSKSSSSKCRNRAADQKRNRRIVMRIEFDDTDEESSSATDNSSADGDDGVGGGGKNDDSDEQPSCSTSIAKRYSGSAPKTRRQKKIEENAKDDSEEFQRNASRCLRNRGRNAFQVNGNSDDSTSSGSEINQRVKTRSGRKKRNFILSEDESSVKQKNARAEEEAGTASDSSSNELLEKCPICLLTFRQQEIGTPGNCEHVFCANCIEAWSKNVQTCPIDRIEFDRIIVRDTYENRQIVREIFVDSEKGKKELILSDDDDDDGAEDLTYCEICKSGRAEDLMLLCDSCNQGYHIFCLSPPLSSIPEGSWYCDNCFDSDDEAGDDNVEEDLNMLYEDIRDMGIPEASLRVTEVHQPRILRTRQNERIRAAVLRHTRANVAGTETTTTTTTTTRGRGRPRNASSTTTTTTTTRTTKPRRRVRRRRRRQTRQRTYVVEYDLNNFDEKFAIKTTKKIIRRRRRRRRQQCTEVRNSSLKPSMERMTASKRLAEQMGVKRDPTYTSQLSGTGTGLSLFGGANDLEYFSDSDPGEIESEVQIETGLGTALQTSVRISNFGSQRSRKGLLLGRLQGNRRVLPIPTTTANSTPDILSSIMDMQDRWHNATRNLGNVRINADGSLNLPATETQGNITNVESGNLLASTERQINLSKVENANPRTGQTNNPSDVVTQAPMYPRGGGGNPNFNRGGAGGGNYNNRFNNQNNYSGGGGSQYRHSTGGGGGGGGGGGSNFNNNMVGRGNFNFSNPNFNNNNAQQNPNFSPFSIRFNTRNQQNNNNQRNNQRNSLPFMNRNDGNMQQQQQPMFNQQQPQQQQHNQQIESHLFSGLPPPIVSHSQAQMQPPSHLRPDENPLFGGLPPPATTLSQNQEVPISIAPPNATLTMSTLMSIPPPPAPPPGVHMPAWNNSLFQLNTDYGNDDDDSNCPNFSVYSAESQDFAKLSERRNQPKNDGEAPKEDDENEDLVQLDDDDDIPMPPEPEKSDLYEPENPTEENEDENDSDDENNKVSSNIVESISTTPLTKSNDDTCEIVDSKNGNNGDDQYDPEQEQDSVSHINSNDDSTTNFDGEPLIEDDNCKEDSNEINAEKREKGKSRNQRRSTSPIVLLPESEEASAANRKGVLELYDDSDWEELDIDKPKGFDKNVSSKDNNVDTPDKSVAEEETQSEANNEVEEPDRSYTPCLDENNDPDEDDGCITPLELEELPGIQRDINADEDSLKRSDDMEGGGASAAGIAEIETELISDEDEVDERRSRGKGKRLRNNKRDRGDKHDKEGSVQAFKKVSTKQKERNYRGDKQPYKRVERRRSSRSRSKSKSLSRSRSRARSPRGKRSRGRGKRTRSRSIRERSRSRSNNKENQFWRQARFSGGQRNSRGRGGFQRYQQSQQRPKRRELPRYDVRYVIGSQQRSAKDRYGRDTSRGRSSRSVSRGRGRGGGRAKSFSRSRTRSLTPKRVRRCSFSISPSPAPLFNRQRSVSPAPVRRFHSPRRRSASPVGRNSPPMRRHSRSPLRMRSHSLSPVHRMNGRKVTRRIRNRSPVPHMISRSRSLSASPRYTPRPRSHSSLSRQKGKKKKSKDRRKKKSRKRVMDSVSPGANIRITRQSDPFFDEPKHTKKKRRHSLTKAKSPVEEGTWSPSPTPPPIQDYERDNNVSWTPPLLMSPQLDSGTTLNLYQPDTQRSGSKSSKKDKRKRMKKKKKTEKRREVRKDKRRQRRTETPESAPSKEVFASGNNILVSVSFNKEAASQQQQQLPQQQTTVVTLPPTREDLLSGRRTSVDRLTNNNITKKKKDRMHKRRKIDTKPVAIIDLERSPFQVHQEPADIIVLTDSEDAHEGEHILDRRERRSESGTQDNDHHRPQISSSARSNSQHDKTPERLDTILEESYDNSHLQTGPKTPPEPPVVKFNMPTKKQNKVRNPLHDEAEINSESEMQERQDQERQEHRQDLDAMHPQNGQKIGPNTPPESGPCSPDAYDPFEPTKSPSLSPRSPTPPPMDVSQTSISDSADGVAPQKHSSDEQRPATVDRDRVVVQQIPGVGNGGMGQQTSTLNPVELVMALMNSKANNSQDLANKSNESQFSTSSHILSSSAASGAGTVGGVGTGHDDSMSLRDKTDETNGITVLSNVLLSTGNTQQSQHIPVISSPTPMAKSNQIMKLPLPKVGGSVGSNSGIGMPASSVNKRNGGVADDSFNVLDIESPYSPGSADYEDLFEPPPDTSNAKRRKTRSGKAEVFDNLFGSSSPVGQLRLPSYTASARKHKAQSGNRKSKVKVGKSADDHVKIYDDVPNSAVELQVKDKFLRKLNRQERVVEEVKLLLKPRFNKKQITKDDYKEIMRRAVPKICHSRSGEINPHKIKNLIEAYVKKFRAKHKKLNIINTGQVSSAVKCAAYLKKL